MKGEPMNYQQIKTTLGQARDAVDAGKLAEADRLIRSCAGMSPNDLGNNLGAARIHKLRNWQRKIQAGVTIALSDTAGEAIAIDDPALFPQVSTSAARIYGRATVRWYTMPLATAIKVRDALYDRGVCDTRGSWDQPKSWERACKRYYPAAEAAVRHAEATAGTETGNPDDDDAPNDTSEIGARSRDPAVVDSRSHKIVVRTFRTCVTVERGAPETMRSQLRAHRNAWLAPQGVEASIKGMLVALADYADRHAQRYGQQIGADGVLGQEWLTMLRAAHGLLNGKTGRLDCGTLSTLCRVLATRVDLGEEWDR